MSPTPWSLPARRVALSIAWCVHRRDTQADRMAGDTAVATQPNVDGQRLRRGDQRRQPTTGHTSAPPI